MDHTYLYMDIIKEIFKPHNYVVYVNSYKLNISTFFEDGREYYLLDFFINGDKTVYTRCMFADINEAITQFPDDKHHYENIRGIIIGYLKSERIKNILNAL